MGWRRRCGPFTPNAICRGLEFLEFLELVKFACKPAMAIGHAVHGVLGRNRFLVVSIGVKADASIVDDVGESVVDMGQKFGGAIGDQIFDEKAIIDPIPWKVADNFHWVPRSLRFY